ncbi:uncharacterized protein LOC6574501 [Drosophila mojavensis]|uniref:Uncharacterized protein n=1 Tax=Drosophila mojavensis TaxID=7230 RepID=B4KDY5_DROMO|nr:uncharacterized protein LOC6574501 [Drosophila mojavensis]EDW16006.1 uncharacterized protein Dmoj_GI10283 [Drosophila mojavensis]
MKLILISALLGCIIATSAQHTTGRPSQASTLSQDVTINEYVSAFSQDATSAESLASTTASKQLSIENQLLHLMTDHTAQMHSSNAFLNEIGNAISQLAVNVQEQIDRLPQLNLTKQQLAKASELAQNQTQQILQKLNKMTHAVLTRMDRTAYNIEYVIQEQEVVKEQINRLQSQLNSHQQHLLNSTESIDKNLLQLTELVSSALLPRIQSLNHSFSSLNHSQSNIQLELKNVAQIKEATTAAVGQLNSLDLQLAYQNLTQNSQLHKIAEAVKNFCPQQVALIDKGLQDLIVAQQRLHSKLSVCERQSTRPKSSEVKKGPEYKSSSAVAQPVAKSYKISEPSQRSYTTSSANPSQAEYYVYGKTSPSQSGKPNLAYGNQIKATQPRLKNVIYENAATKAEPKSSDFYINDMTYPSKHDKDSISETKQHNKNDLTYDLVEMLANKSQDLLKPDDQLSKSVEIYNGKPRQPPQIYEFDEGTSQNQAEAQSNAKYIFGIVKAQSEQPNANHKTPQFKPRRIGSTYYGNAFSSSYAQVPQS